MEKLALESPVLVDLFYAHSLEQPADTAEIDKLLLELDNVGSDFSPYQQAIAAMNLNLYQRHYMAKKLCEKFAEQGVYASFELSQFIDFQDYDPANCLTKIIAFSGQITTDFFNHPSTFLSKVYFEIQRYAFNQAVQALKNQNITLAKDLAGYPHGRDALMLVLERKKK